MANGQRQPEGLIGVLLDPSARLDERDDAAMDLAKFDEPSVEEALLQVVLNHSEDELVADSAGESLRNIWDRKLKYVEPLVAQMHPAARRLFDAP